MGRSATLGRRVGERYTNHQVTIIVHSVGGGGGGYGGGGDGDGQSDT